MPGPGDTTPAPTPPPPAVPTPAPPPRRSPHPMSRPAAAPAAEDAPMGFADEEGSAASSRSSDAGDDLLREDRPDDDDNNEREGMAVEREQTPTVPHRALAPTSSSHLASPPGPGARRSQRMPGPSRGGMPSGAGGSGRNARLTRAAAAYGGGGGEFDRERVAMARGAAGDSEARSAEESAWSKVLDKDYAGKITYDPFYHQLAASSRHAAAAASTSTPSAPGPSAPAAAPSAAPATPSAPTAPTDAPASVDSATPPVPPVASDDLPVAPAATA